jgi:hypothetical protein
MSQRRTSRRRVMMRVRARAAAAARLLCAGTKFDHFSCISLLRSQFHSSAWARRFPELQQLPGPAVSALLRQEDPAALDAVLGPTPPAAGAPEEDDGRSSSHYDSSTNSSRRRRSTGDAVAAAHCTVSLQLRPQWPPAEGRKRAVAWSSNSSCEDAHAAAAPEQQPSNSVPPRDKPSMGAAALMGKYEQGVPSYFVTGRRSRGSVAAGLQQGGGGGGRGSPAPVGAMNWAWGQQQGGHRVGGGGSWFQPPAAAQSSSLRAEEDCDGADSTGAEDEHPRPRTCGAAAGFALAASSSNPAALFCSRNRTPVWSPSSQRLCWTALPPQSHRHSARSTRQQQLDSTSRPSKPAFRPASPAEAKACISWPPDAIAALAVGPAGANQQLTAHPPRDPEGARLHGGRLFVPSGVLKAQLSGRAACGYFSYNPNTM